MQAENLQKSLSKEAKAKLKEPLKAAKKALRGKDSSEISDVGDTLEKAIEPFAPSEDV